MKAATAAALLTNAGQAAGFATLKVEMIRNHSMSRTAEMAIIIVQIRRLKTVLTVWYLSDGKPN